MSLLSENISFLSELYPDKVTGNKHISNFLDDPAKIGAVELITLSEFYGIIPEHLVMRDLREVHRLKASLDIKLLLLDVDGVMTDGGMYFTENGDEIKRFNTKDGRAIMACNRQGIEVRFISSGVKEKVIRDRAERLGVKEIYVGKGKKSDVVEEWVRRDGVGYDQIAYVGDDVNDLPVMKKVGLACCPADAVRAVKKVAHWTLDSMGGAGCIREFVETFLFEVER